MMTNPLPPQAHDLIALLNQVLSDPTKHKEVIAGLSDATKMAMEAQEAAFELKNVADQAMKDAKKFDAQARADAIARDTALKNREHALVIAEAEFARKHEAHTFDVQALERKKGELRDLESQHKQAAGQLEGFIAALNGREASLVKREAAANDLDAKNKAFAEQLAHKKAHIDKLFAD
jgi:hypothetical protein